MFYALNNNDFLFRSTTWQWIDRVISGEIDIPDDIDYYSIDELSINEKRQIYSKLIGDTGIIASMNNIASCSHSYYNIDVFDLQRSY